MDASPDRLFAKEVWMSRVLPHALLRLVIADMPTTLTPENPLLRTMHEYQIMRALKAVAPGIFLDTKKGMKEQFFGGSARYVDSHCVESFVNARHRGGMNDSDMPFHHQERERDLSRPSRLSSRS